MGDFDEAEFLEKEVNKEEARMRRLFGEDAASADGGLGSASPSREVRTIVRPTMRAKGSAEAAFERGETEEDMIKRKTRELKAKAHQKQKREKEPEWKIRQREKEEIAKREYALRERQEAEQRAKSQKEAAERARAVASGELVTGGGDRDRDELLLVIKQRKEREARELAESTAAPVQQQVSESEYARREAARLRGHWLSTEAEEEKSAPAPQQTSQPAASTKAATAPKSSSPKAGAAGWNINRVCEWLASIGLEDSKVGEVQAAFRNNDIVGPALVSLTKEDLQEMGITSLGIKKTIAAAVEQLPKN